MAWTVRAKNPEEVSRRLAEEDNTYWWNQRELPEFNGIDGATVRFLERPLLRPAVQFSCVVMLTGEERYWRALDHADDVIRLQALTCLMSVRAPVSIDDQVRVLSELEATLMIPQGVRLLRDLRNDLSTERLARLLELEPSESRHANETDLEWALRAAGIMQDSEHFARVAELALSDNLSISLAAGRALEDYEGPEADRALLACVSAWNYDSYLRAADALIERDPEALEELLFSMRVPPGQVHWKAIILGRMGNPDAVPLLIETLPNITLKGSEMLKWIVELAGEEHRALIEELPNAVRPDQYSCAAGVRDSVLRRLDGQP